MCQYCTKWVAMIICYLKLDIHTKQSSQQSKEERQKHLTNKCKQYWMSKWLTPDNQLTTGQLMKHNIRHRYLNIEQYVRLDYENAKNGSIIPLHKLRKKSNNRRRASQRQ